MISANTHDALVAEAEQARAAVVAATATLRAAELELSYTRVISPIAGRIGESLVDGGNLVSGGNAGGTLLAEIVSTGPCTWSSMSTSPRTAACSRPSATRRAGSQARASPWRLPATKASRTRRSSTS